MSVDIAATDYPSHSPYNYAHNNPVRYRDYLGMGPIDGDGVEDHIKVNSKGIVTEVIPMEGPNKFFDDQTGEELTMNDAENNPNDAALLSKKINVGDRLYQNISNSEILGFLVRAGVEPGQIRSKGILHQKAGYLKAMELSIDGNVADFPSQLYNSGKYNIHHNSSPDGKHSEFKGLPMRINGGNKLYNPSDAGQYIWGAWMRSNGFTKIQTWLGSNINEIDTPVRR